MAQDGDHAENEQDLSHIHWSWPEAIAANPTRSLSTPDLAMDYFAFSPFWDPNSNNNVLRTQRRVENPTYGHAQEKFELQAFKSGVEYIVAHSLPPDLFVIHKRQVDNGVREKVLAIYFILEGKIYPTPSLYDVMSSRLTNATHLISKTFATLSSAHPPANPRMTSQWRSLPSSSVDTTKSINESEPKPSEATGSGMGPPSGHAIDQDAATLTESAAGGSKSMPDESAQPDWKLFNALNTTRSSLSDLTSLSRQPAPKLDPLQEIKDIEARLLSSLNTSQRPGAGSKDAGSQYAISALPGQSMGRIGPTRGGYATSQMLGLSVNSLGGSKAGSVISFTNVVGSPLNPSSG